MGKLWDLVEAHRRAQVYRPSDRQIAAKLGVAPNALVGWRNPKKPPNPENLRKLAELIGEPESVVVRAALVDTGYWHEDEPMEDRTEREDGEGPRVSR